MARRPFNGAVVITQEYGAPNSFYRKGYHTGVDYGLNQGTEVVSPTNGTVIETGYESSRTNGRGNYIIIKGDDGVSHNLYHMRDFALVRSGRVAEGQLVGYVGNTGASEGAHLHWETRRAPYDGNSDFPPGTWLFADRNVYVPQPQAPATREFVRVFGDFRTLYSAPGVRTTNRISPNQFGGHLDYVVLERSGNYVKIQTQMYGTKWIYVGADVASLTQFFKA